MLDLFCEESLLSQEDITRMKQTVLEGTFDIVSRFYNVSVKNDHLGTEEPSVFGPGFKTVPGGSDYLNRTVMSWHYYCWFLGNKLIHSADPQSLPVLIIIFKFAQNKTILK